MSYLRDAQVGGARLNPRDYIAKLPFLRDELGSIPFTGTTTLFVRFSDSDEHVTEISIAYVRATIPARLRIQLMREDGAAVSDTSISLDGIHGQPVSIPVEPANAYSLALEVTPSSDASGKLWIDDLRVLGQRPALQRYIAEHLHFPTLDEKDYP